MEECQAHLIPSLPTEHSQLIASFYKFIWLKKTEIIKMELEKLCSKENILGTILLANEGLNGTISGSPENVKNVLIWLYRDERICGVNPKFSSAKNSPFYRMKIRLKKEIISMGKILTSQENLIGKYVNPSNWNEMLNDPDTLIIDVRNNYEIAIGSFKNALNPNTNSFREFPHWLENHLRSLPPNNQPKNIAMFCTGGIRCEKATSLLISNGYENAFHLEGGILGYLESTPIEDSEWKGECFVFDQRVSVTHGLKLGKLQLCFGCRTPLSENDMGSHQYEPGVACPHCFDKNSKSQLERFRERHKQITLAENRGIKHLGFKKNS